MDASLEQQLAAAEKLLATLRAIQQLQRAGIAVPAAVAPPPPPPAPPAPEAEQPPAPKAKKAAKRPADEQEVPADLEPKRQKRVAENYKITEKMRRLCCNGNVAPEAVGRPEVARALEVIAETRETREALRLLKQRAPKAMWDHGCIPTWDSLFGACVADRIGWYFYHRRSDLAAADPALPASLTEEQMRCLIAPKRTDLYSGSEHHKQFLEQVTEDALDSRAVRCIILQGDEATVRHALGRVASGSERVRASIGRALMSGRYDLPELDHMPRGVSQFLMEVLHTPQAQGIRNLGVLKSMGAINADAMEYCKAYFVNIEANVAELNEASAVYRRQWGEAESHFNPERTRMRAASALELFSE